MRFREENMRGVTVIYAEGDFVVSAVPCGVQSRVKMALDRGDRHLVLNLAGIRRMDSSCLGEVVASYTSALGRGGRLGVAAPTDHVLHLLRLTRLDTVIHVFATDEEAVAHFVAHEGATA